MSALSQLLASRLGSGAPNLPVAPDFWRLFFHRPRPKLQPKQYFTGRKAGQVPERPRTNHALCGYLRLISPHASADFAAHN